MSVQRWVHRNKWKHMFTMQYQSVQISQSSSIRMCGERVLLRVIDTLRLIGFGLPSTNQAQGEYTRSISATLGSHEQMEAHVHNVISISSKHITNAIARMLTAAQASSGVEKSGRVGRPNPMGRRVSMTRNRTLSPHNLGREPFLRFARASTQR